MHTHENDVYSVNPANFIALTPLSFLERAKDIYPDYPAVIYGPRKYNWLQVSERCQHIAKALTSLGIERGDTVSVLAANTPEMFECHYAIPMSGAMINTINYRLDVNTIAYILEHADTKVLITDTQFSPTVKKALSQLNKDIIVIDIVDDQAILNDGEGERLGKLTYDDLFNINVDEISISSIEDEWQALSLNYTSGTGGRPKGVVYHHRGSYLMSMGTIAAWPMSMHAKYLYTVPMFHCNGWGHAWTLGAVAGTAICCRYIVPKDVFTMLEEHKVTHFGAAPIVLNMLSEAAEATDVEINHRIQVMTAGAPPPSSTLAKTAKLGFNITHVYGLTETYGHVIYCAWREQWDSLNIDEQADIKARQGVRFPMTEAVNVIDPLTGEEVAHDGKTLGEIVIRSNTMMKGYYKNPEATEKAFKDGWFHSEDLAVVYPDGYLEVKDRLKDIIISGGENISSIEVESILYKHPDVLAAAVVAKADEKWGETPCAFIELRNGSEINDENIVEFCRQYLAGFKIPKNVVFKELPKTSTGKVQKFLLREEAKNF